MLRASLIAAFTLTTALPLSAAAEDCTCMVPEIGLRSIHPTQSQDLGPFFSSDGTSLSSRATSGANGNGEPGEILWCWSSHDPRCSPSDAPQDHGPRALRSGHGVGIVATASDWPPPDAGSDFSHPDARGHGRPGVRARVERPPRA